MIPTNIVNRVYNVAAFGAIPGAGIDNTKPIQDALESAQQDGGELYFPPGVWEYNETLHLQSTSQAASLHKVRGSGWRSELRYLGSGSAFAHVGALTGLIMADFQLRGTAEAGAGIDLGSPGSLAIGQVTIENVFIRRFDNGVGLRLGEAYFTRLVGNRIFDTEVGIECQRAISCEVRSNLVRRWQLYGIHLGNAVTLSANNLVSANTVDEPRAAAGPDRAGIWLESATSTVVDGNYFECLGNHLKSKKCAEGFPHGILIKGATRSQSNTISNNYFSGNNGFKDSARGAHPGAGFAVWVAANTSKTQIAVNHLGSYVLRDDGNRTTFMMAVLGDIEGSGVLRTGWSISGDQVTQHH